MNERPKVSIEGDEIGTGDGVASGVAEGAGRGNGEGAEVEEPGAGGQVGAGGVGAFAADAVGLRELGGVAEARAR